jgi:hypothetical protein
MRDSPIKNSKRKEGGVEFVDDYVALEQRIEALIGRGDIAEQEFNDAALAVHRFQRAQNEPFGKYCRHLGVPYEVNEWRAIPAVPQSAFKRFALRAFSAEQTVKTFRTSGTTGEGYGEHHFRSLRLYDTAILGGWDALNLPQAALLILAPNPEKAPHSSLTHMMSVLAGERGSPASQFILEQDGQLDIERFLAAMRSCFDAHQPVGLLGTALAFLRLFEQLGGRPVIRRKGSFAMETGGYKGSGRDITKSALYAKFGEHFELKPDRIFNEYGMTELSSQCYARGLNTPHDAPPWMRALVIDPESGREVAPGEAGVLRLYDLANLGSVFALQTQDLAICRERGFELLGRDPGALPRGCSRAADESMRR